MKSPNHEAIYSPPSTYDMNAWSFTPCPYLHFIVGCLYEGL